MRLHDSTFTLADLICKYVAGTLTDEEAALLAEWKARPENQELYERLVNLEEINKKFSAYGQFDSARALAKAKERIAVQPAPQQKLYPWLRYAAVLFVACLAGVLYFYLSGKHNAGRVGTTPQLAQQETANGNAAPIMAAKGNAVLLLASGETIDLTEPERKQLTLGGLEVKNENNLLAYPSTATSAEVSYNTLQVPVGGAYQVQLPDGSRVWLNSASSLRYPTQFAGGKREVELQGEAYFEVKKDNRQFVVTTGEVQVQVLGTAFNLSAYPGDATIATTLVEGKVRMSGSGHETILNPDKQAVYSKSDKQLHKRDVDTYAYTAWRNGELHFKKEKLKHLMARLSRWYAFDVTYANPALKEKEFTGIALKDKPLEHILRLISKTAGIDYRIENNTVILLEQE